MNNVVLALTRVVKRTHPKVSEADAFARAHALADTNAFGVTNGRLHPAGDIHRSAAAAKLDSRTVRTVAIEAYPPPVNGSEWDRASHTNAVLRGMGIDAVTFDYPAPVVTHD